MKILPCRLLLNSSIKKEYLYSSRGRINRNVRGVLTYLVFRGNVYACIGLKQHGILNMLTNIFKSKAYESRQRVVRLAPR